MAGDAPGADQQPPEQAPPPHPTQTPPSVTPLPAASVEIARFEASSASAPIPPQYFGLLIVLVVISLATALGFTGHQQAASVFGGTTIVGLAVAFAVGRFRARDNGQSQA